MREVINGVLKWQSDTDKSYRCPTCGTWIRTNHNGDAFVAIVECGGPLGDHVIELGEL